MWNKTRNFVALNLYSKVELCRVGLYYFFLT